MHWLTDPFATQFMRHAAVVAVLVGLLAPAVGVWVILRSMAYLGDAMSHGTLAGVAAAAAVGVSTTVGALLAGLVMGAAIAMLGDRPRLREDTAIGVVETVMFATGVLLLTRHGTGVDLTHILFGQLVTVSRHDVAVHLALAGLAAVVLVGSHRDLALTTFDPLHAAQVGVDVARTRHVLAGLVSVTVVVALSTVGLLMSVALLVTPAATARLVCDRLAPLTALACGLGVGGSLAGLVLAYHLATPPGATIALVQAGAFACALGASSAATARRARRTSASCSASPSRRR